MILAGDGMIKLLTHIINIFHSFRGRCYLLILSNEDVLLLGLRTKVNAFSSGASSVAIRVAALARLAESLP